MYDRRGPDQGTGKMASPKRRAPVVEGTTEAEPVIFVCVACEVPLTRPLTRLPEVPEAPYYAWWDAEEPGPSPSTVPTGCYAIETEPYGVPLLASEVPAQVMPRYGTMSDQHGQWLVSQGPRDNIVINPDDALGLEYHHASSACCGATPTGGLNQRCACGTLVATLSSDCCCPYELHLSADHVRAVGP
ncbi:hypothetical protein [Streptomyces sp. NPDC013489]|uniref:hypothetical protein n=1 Tax=Streptomyces sp. NPDC013489 TaxID=3155606 RepID=UPI0033CC9C40